MVWLSESEKVLCFDTLKTCNRQTDRWADYTEHGAVKAVDFTYPTII